MSVSWRWRSSNRWEDEPGAKFPPYLLFSALTEAQVALNFRENIQRPQLEMNFSINDLSTQIFPLMTQFPHNFLLGAARVRLICLCCHPAIFTLVRTWLIRTVSDSLWAFRESVTEPLVTGSGCNLTSVQDSPSPCLGFRVSLTKYCTTL